MIAVCVDGDGNYRAGVTRWNHENGGTEDTVSTTKLTKLLGTDFYKTFLPNNKLSVEINDTKQKLKNSDISLKQIFKHVTEITQEISIVEITKKYNLINVNTREFLFDKWYDKICKYNDVLVGIFNQHKGTNLFDVDTKKFIFDSWVDGVTPFDDYHMQLYNNEKFNLFNIKTNSLMFDTWYDGIYRVMPKIITLFTKGEGYRIFNIATNKFTYNGLLSNIEIHCRDGAFVKLKNGKDGKVNSSGIITLKDGTVLDKENINETTIKYIVNYYLR